MSEFKNLPSGWKVVRLGDVCEINPSSRKLPEKFYYIDLESVEKGILHSLKEVFLETAPSRAQRLLEKGDILFQMVRPYQKNNFLFELNGNFVASTGYAQIRTKQNRDFIFQYLNFDTFTKKVIEKCTGSNYPAINASVFSNLMILLPPLDEQKKIAEILSTWDEAINLTINLIESKKQFKKALMQNLLTAKIRFLQFKDEWKIIRLKKISSRVTRRNQDNRCQNVLTISAQFGLINQTDFFNKQVASKDLSNYILLKKGEFAYNKSYSTGYSFGAFKRLKFYEEGIASPLYIYFKFNDDVCSDFFEFYFDAGQANRQIKDIVQEGARNHGLLNLSIDDFFNIKIRMPNLKEQQKIAEVLTACDDEINLLNLKLENLKKQKQGLMQKLLSGDIRTKVKGGKNVKMDD